MLKRMKKLNLIMLGIVAFTMMLLFQSCLDDDGYSLDEFRISVATVASDSDTYHHFRLDDGKTLFPVAGNGYTGHNLMDGQRVLLNYTLLGDSTGSYSHPIKVNAIDKILTKKIAENEGEKNDSIYGKDPVSIKDIWIGDGYLNIWFAANFGGYKKHFVNLLQIDAEANPYELEFRHNAYDDPATASSHGIVCFDLSDLPDTEEETVMLTVQVNAFGGTKTYELKYNTEGAEGTDSLPSTLKDGYYEEVN